MTHPPDANDGPGENAPQGEAPLIIDDSTTDQARIQALEADLAKHRDQLLRTLAEGENTRRRAQREIEENNKFAVANFAREVLGVADNLRRALETITAEARRADERIERFAAGVELTERELLAVLERFAVKRVDPMGQPFDHNLHQAIMQVDRPDLAPGTVVQVMQSGFTIHGRLLRPAMVALAKGGPAPGGQVDTQA
jgi:molecular chaperone GrpE